MDINCLLQDDDFKIVDFDKALCLKEYSHAAHCCIYAAGLVGVCENHVMPALISMQMRFDGRIGFPGGLVNSQNIVAGLNRELKEEINLDDELFATVHDYLYTSVRDSKKLCMHFYSKQVTMQQFEAMEKNVFDAKDYGLETFGMIRVPLHFMSGNLGFPQFLKNSFAGSAKLQLLNFLVHSNLMSKELISVALNSSV